MPRIDCPQQGRGPSGPGAEEALFETGFLRNFAGISGTQRVLSIVRLRHPLEEHDLSPKILQLGHHKLAARGLPLKTGTVVDAALIAAPHSTKNSASQREPGRQPTKRGNQWHFAMKAHINTDAKPRWVHTASEAQPPTSTSEARAALCCMDRHSSALLIRANCCAAATGPAQQSKRAGQLIVACTGKRRKLCAGFSR